MNIRPQFGAVQRSGRSAATAVSHRLAGLLAIALLVFATIVQATHVHGGRLRIGHTSTQLDHVGGAEQDGSACALCAAMHSLHVVATTQIATVPPSKLVEVRAYLVQGVAPRLHFEVFGRPPPLFV